eukprot:6214665-Pleurochrysis_carterae.AAC.4
MPFWGLLMQVSTHLQAPQYDRIFEKESIMQVTLDHDYDGGNIGATEYHFTRQAYLADGQSEVE